MQENKTGSTYRRKLLIIAISVISLLFFNTAFANFGRGPGGSLGITLVLNHGQYPEVLKKYGAAEVYALYLGQLFTKIPKDGTHGDTIVNYKKFMESHPNVTGYRLIYKSNENIDSVYQLDAKFRISKKAYPINNGKIHILSFDSTLKKTDEFVYDYTAKILSPKKINSVIILEALLREYIIYNSYDRSNYALGAVWILSIGIDDYGETKYRTTKIKNKIIVESRFACNIF